MITPTLFRKEYDKSLEVIGWGPFAYAIAIALMEMPWENFLSSPLNTPPLKKLSQVKSAQSVAFELWQQDSRGVFKSSLNIPDVRILICERLEPSQKESDLLETLEPASHTLRVCANAPPGRPSPIALKKAHTMVCQLQDSSHEVKVLSVLKAVKGLAGASIGPNLICFDLYDLQVILPLGSISQFVFACCRESSPALSATQKALALVDLELLNPHSNSALLCLSKGGDMTFGDMESAALLLSETVGIDIQVAFFSEKPKTAETTAYLYLSDNEGNEDRTPPKGPKFVFYTP